ncbi:uncharacterized protein LOC117121634 isoform X2 [Anneissia japonica]|nr:uncharacterized protein LOC117121634 isoform X2 [Anneissia japonica]
MTEFLEQVKKLGMKNDSCKPSETSESTSTTPVHKKQPKPTKNAAVQVGKSVVKPSNSDNTSFGGMKKGFLFSAGKSKPPTKSKMQCEKTKTVSNELIQSNDEDLTVLKPKKETRQHEIPEVQEAMKDSVPSWLDRSWITRDLLATIEKHPKLAKQIQQPKFAMAVAQFQESPQKAMSDFQNDPELQQFFREFFSVLGDHFTKLGDSQAVPTSPTAVPCGSPVDATAKSSNSSSNSKPKQSTEEDELRMQKILADPKIQEVLADTRIQRLIEMLRKEPHKVQGLLQRASADLKPKVQRLVDSGLLAYQP